MQLRRRYLICAAVAKSRYMFIHSNYMQEQGAMAHKHMFSLLVVRVRAGCCGQLQEKRA